MSIAAESRVQGQPERAHERRKHQCILVMGSTGYIGGRLVSRLLDAGFSVRCLVRQARKLESRPWIDHAKLTIIPGDAGDRAALDTALAGCSAAFYLIHSMIVAGSSYRKRDRELAEVFAHAAKDAGLTRIIYLGGLGETGAGLSDHLASRREVETTLAATGIPVTVLRAAMIIGSGSASFEILRYLVERLPIMVTPKWVSTESQPIAVQNVLHYLAGCLDQPATTGRTLDIGGADILTYREIMQEMARALGVRRRFIIPVPVLTPRLSSLWIHLVTPLSQHIARPLSEGLKNRVVCRNDDAAQLMPQPLLSVREALEEAVGAKRADGVETAWSDAGPVPGDPDWAGGHVFEDRRVIEIARSPRTVFRSVCKIGGGQGYYAADWLWRVRGWMDRLVGGPGLRRGRRNAAQVAYGEALDFWRVTGIEANRRLELRAEMKLPGEAQLSFAIEPLDSTAARCRLVQTARFKPRGLLGLVYWYAVLPLHAIVFSGMLNGICRAAETNTTGTCKPSLDPAS
jgi:uncharacterized protein YbjT (DUF2867 family)